MTGLTIKNLRTATEQPWDSDAPVAMENQRRRAEDY